MDVVVSGKRRRGRPRRSDNTREDMNKCELTADMAENRPTDQGGYLEGS